MAFRVQPPPEGTLYAVLQKAKPGWSTKDLVKVYQKLQKVSITDGESLARAVSEGSLNEILASVGERKLKPSTLQLLRLASRDPGKKVASHEELPLLGGRHCFCGSCIRVPMCQPRSAAGSDVDVLSLKLPSIRALGPPPLMPSRFRGARPARPRQAMAPLPRVKSEPVLKTEPPRSRLGLEGGARKLTPPTPPASTEQWQRKVLPSLAPVPERTRRSVVLPLYLVIGLPVPTIEEEPAVPAVPPAVPPAAPEAEARRPSIIHSSSTSSFHSYGTFVEMQGLEEDLPHLEAEAYSTQESYAMTFEGGSSQPSRSDSLNTGGTSGTDAATFGGGAANDAAGPQWGGENSEEDLSGDDRSYTSFGDEDMNTTMEAESDERRPFQNTREALKELVDLDETMHVSRSPQPRGLRGGAAAAPSKAAASDHRRQVAARRQQQRRRMIRAYG